MPKIFPNTNLDPSAQSMDYFLTDRGGKVTFTGIGGGALGKRAHCIASGEMVATEHGARPIETVQVGDLVWTWNHATYTRELKPVRARVRTPQQPVQRVTARGVQIRCTDDHLLFDGIAYTKVSSLTSKDSLYVDYSLRLLPHAYPHPPRRQAPEVLQPQVPRRGASQTPSSVRVLRGRAEHEAQTCTLLRDEVPFRSVTESATSADVRMVQEGVLRGEPQEHVLRESLREPRPQREDARNGEPELEDWEGGRQVLPDISQHAECGHTETRRREVRVVPRHAETPRSPPHRRETAQRRRDEPDNLMLRLPCAVAQISPVPFEGRDDDGYSDVYDLDVSDNHNFFVNGILVHNCLVVDDPFKDEYEARSELHQKQVFDWLLSVARSRLHPFGAIIVIHQRWHVHDLIGRLLEHAASNPTGDQWTDCQYPMVATEDCGWRKKGDSVHKERFSNAWCERTRNSVSEWVWSAMYQQSPTLDSGRVFRREWFKLLPREKFPKNLTWYISTDFAATEGRGDHSVSRPFAVDENDNIYFVDPFHAQVSPDVAHKATFDLYQKYGARAIFVEKGGLWNAAQGTFRREQEARRVYPRIVQFNRTTNKAEHAASLIAHMAAGKVYHLDSPFTHQVVIPQYMNFTGEKGVSEEDDIVDTDYLPFLSWTEVRRPSPTVNLPSITPIPEINQGIEAAMGKAGWKPEEENTDEKFWDNYAVSWH